jgi:uncharacterized protein (TIGR00252 family)
MITAKVGQAAEAAVADYLQTLGYEILQRNYRTRVCEIDIVAKKDKIIHFVEVKYRSNDIQGDGLAYITSKKLKQLRFAAEIWTHQHDWNGDYVLEAASVDGSSGGFLVSEPVDVM